MPSALTYPGVYVEEMSSGVRTITGIPTSITAFVGRTFKGPSNIATTINSYADYERKFGGLWKDSTVSFAVRDFYLNGGSQAIIVRLFHPLFDTEELRQDAWNAGGNAGATAANAIAAAAVPDHPLYPNDPVTMEDLLAKAQAAAGLYVGANDAQDAAAAYLLRVAKDATGNLQYPPSKLLVDAAGVAATYTNDPEKSAAESVRLKVEAAVRAKAAPINVFKAARDRAATFVNPPATDEEIAAANAVAVKLFDDIMADSQIASAAIAAAVAEAAKQAGNAVAPVPRAQITYDTLTLHAANEGAWANGLRIRVDYEVDPVAEDGDSLFNLTIRDTKTGETETLRNLSMKKDHARFVKNVLAAESLLLRADDVADGANRPRPHGAALADKGVFDDDASSKGVTTSASDGCPLVGADYTNSGPRKGILALDHADLFSLLCIPPTVHDSNGNATLPPAVWAAAASYCEARRAMLIVDPPDAIWKSKDQVLDANTGIQDFRGRATSSKNAAIFFPAVIQPNPLKEGQYETFAPCGVVAGVIARTDSQRGIWKAPAGLDATLTGVPRLQVPLTDLENGELNPRGVNCLRTMPGAGNVIWGSRTLEGDDRRSSEYKYIPVRRTALYIEESLYRGTQWVVFEPNDEPLWAQIRLNVGAFMNGMFRQGAFQGTSPRDAYLVKCDHETTTQADINLGVVNIIVGFAPLKPAEFVIIKLQQLAGQIQA